MEFCSKKLNGFGEINEVGEIFAQNKEAGVAGSFAPKKINGVGGMNVVGEFLVKINKGVEGISSSNFQNVSLWGVLKG